MNQGAVSIMQFHFSVVIGSQLVASAMSPVGTNRTNRAGLVMSVDRGRPEVAFRGREDRS